MIITGATGGWRATREWVDPATGKPDVAALARLFGEDEVSVHDSRGGTREMRLSEYIAWWTRRGGEGDEELGLYLKDWHCAALHPQYCAYETPACLGEDWLNEHWASPEQQQQRGESGGDHRFVYIGPRGSSTRLHADVLFSYSWSVNVVGRKRWRLVPASERMHVSDAGTRPLASWLSELPATTATGSAPLVHALEVVQEAGELLFVPSGWYHEVVNLEDTISINHNWLTAHNAEWALRRLRETLDDLRGGLGEDADDLELLEGLVERRCGLGMFGWAELLEGVLRRRTPPVENEEDDVAYARARVLAVLRETLDWIESCCVGVDADETGCEDLEPHRRASIERQRLLLLEAETPAKDTPAGKRRKRG